jgi:glucose/arabinose dehydrogenase
MGKFRQWTWVAAVLAALVPSGCGDSSGDSLPTNNVPQVTINVEPVFPNLTFNSPVAMLQAPNDPSRWFVVEQRGVVRAFSSSNNATTTSSVFVDISSRVTFPPQTELGLLGMAFHPQFPITPSVYLFYSTNDPKLGLVSRISEFISRDLGATLDPAPTAERVLMTIPKPNGETNHNGGNLAFGPDGLLYAGIGDGGGGNDQHGAFGNAQATNTVLGKMLRINVLPGSIGGLGYNIPPSNPFFGSPPNPPCNIDDPINRPATQPCPEIFAVGFRNPFRWSFDRGTGQLWVGDVGQSALEEVDRVDIGQNYGWRCFEGTRNTGFPCGATGPTQFPVAQYGRDVGTTVIGGYVYRGSRFPGLIGRYIFGDFGSRRIFNIDSAAQGTLTLGSGFSSNVTISSFGEDVAGELYVVDYGTGELFRIRQ